ncbi:IclR family transcriptional regulator [Paraburkholderia youngii]|uniref:IclR family transcriptional regulator n=1 Tax=Paraburkholderia youngii TaxID=2782701 RepID=UPI003D217268
MQNKPEGPAAGDSVDSGTHQNIARTALVMDAIAAASSKGIRFTDVVKVTQLNKTVAHRCLAGLVAYGLALFDSDSARYYLGDRIFAWTAMARERFEISERVKSHLDALAEKLEDTIYFVVRRGDFAVCYGRAEGAYPIKTLTLRVGDRRPLGVGSSSLAIAAALPDNEVQRLLRDQSAEREAFRFTDAMFVSEVERARNDGYASMDGHLIPGMTGVALAVRDVRGRPVAAVSVAAISNRLEEPRRSEVVAAIREEVAAIEKQLSHLLADL